MRAAGEAGEGAGGGGPGFLSGSSRGGRDGGVSLGGVSGAVMRGLLPCARKAQNAPARTSPVLLSMPITIELDWTLSRWVRREL